MQHGLGILEQILIFIDGQAGPCMGVNKKHRVGSFLSRRLAKMDIVLHAV